MTTYAEYDAIPAVRWSDLRALTRSPLAYRARIDGVRLDSPAMFRGRLIHTAVLEPDELPKRYLVWHGTRRGKAWDEFKAAAGEAEIITEAEYNDALAVRDAVRSHPAVARYLTQRKVATEQTVTWTDAATGLPCKARMDIVCSRTAIDLKTTRDIDARAFGRSAAALHYHGQAAFYLRGLKATRKRQDWRFTIVAVETEPPYDVAVYRLTDDQLWAGDELAGDLLDTLRRCQRSDRWPGRYPKELPLELPPWVFPDYDSESFTVEKG
jgi:hypothetical protein